MRSQDPNQTGFNQSATCEDLLVVKGCGLGNDESGKSKCQSESSNDGCCSISYIITGSSPLKEEQNTLLSGLGKFDLSTDDDRWLASQVNLSNNPSSPPDYMLRNAASFGASFLLRLTTDQMFWFTFVFHGSTSHLG